MLTILSRLTVSMSVIMNWSLAVVHCNAAWQLTLTKTGATVRQLVLGPLLVLWV